MNADVRLENVLQLLSSLPAQKKRKKKRKGRERRQSMDRNRNESFQFTLDQIKWIEKEWKHVSDCSGDGGHVFFPFCPKVLPSGTTKRQGPNTYNKLHINNTTSHSHCLMDELIWNSVEKNKRQKVESSISIDNPSIVMDENAMEID